MLGNKSAWIGEAQRAGGIEILGGGDNIRCRLDAGKACGAAVTEITIHVANAGGDAAETIVGNARGVSQGIAGDHQTSGIVVLKLIRRAISKARAAEQTRVVVSKTAGAASGRGFFEDAARGTANDLVVESGGIVADKGGESERIELEIGDQVTDPSGVLRLGESLAGHAGEGTGEGGVGVGVIDLGKQGIFTIAESEGSLAGESITADGDEAVAGIRDGFRKELQQWVGSGVVMIRGCLAEQIGAGAGQGIKRVHGNGTGDKGSAIKVIGGVVGQFEGGTGTAICGIGAFR